jgi:EAL domain-containing protein (putative c-di-GMP-specific phosphodiesterase class I)/HAMP domain-containing protein
MMAFVITLIVATVISMYGTYRSKAMVEASNEAYISSLANELALEMDNFIQLQKGYLNGQVSALTYMGDYSAENLATFTYNMADGNDFMLYSYFNTLTDSGHFTSSDGWMPPEGYSWENRYWVELVSEMEPVFVDFPSYDSGTENIVTVLRKRVFDEQVQGILNMAINLDELSQKLKTYQLPDGAEALLIDENGLLVAYHDPNIFKNQSEALLINDIIEGFDKALQTFEIGDKTFTSKKLNDVPWTLWVSVPTSFYYSGVRETVTHFMIIYFVTFLISLFIANAISKKISTPIVKLRSHAENIGQGDYTQEISSDLMAQEDEIGRLAVTFQSMRENILQRKSELEHNYMEIQALYEEMAASEEALKENYDALNLYKDKVEYYAFHNAQTGFYNRDFLIQTLNRRPQSDDMNHKAFIYLSYKELTHYFETVGQTILELIHYKLGIAISNHIAKEDSVQLFDLSLGKFGVLLKETEYFNIDQMLLALKSEVSSMKTLEALTIKVSMVVGGYVLDDNDMNEDQGTTIIEKAESAMLSNQFSLNHESNITWFDDALHQKRVYETQIESGLFEAIKRNEISVVYQPQFDQRGSIVGVEALMRWTHGKLGNVPPIEFIPRAENLGVIDQLDQFMISEVLRFQSELKTRHGIEMPIAVNISVVELLDPQFLERIENDVKKYEVDREMVIFELTETAFSKHLSLVKDNIVKLMALGYQLHLDDFGTGYSSLSYLSEFPVNAIKIDRSFVSTFLENPKVLKVISTMIDLAKKLDAQIIAEGVETIEQYKGLAELGCFTYQGFLFSKPIDKESLVTMLNATLQNATLQNGQSS